MILTRILLLRQFGLVVIYTAALSFCLWFSYQLRFDFNASREELIHLERILIISVACKIVCLRVFGQFGSLLSYFGIHDAQKIFLATLLSSLISLAARYHWGIDWAPPRAVIITDLTISFVALCSIRMGFRLIREGYLKNGQELGAPRRRVGIIGAGHAGASLVKDLHVRRGLGKIPVAFFDDDRVKWNTKIHGVSVVGAPELLPEYLEKNPPLDEVIIALPPGAGSKRMREIVRLLTGARLKFEIIPSLEELVTGKVRISQLRAVEIDDLLGRTAVNLETDRIRELVQGRVVMVTGAGGSIGSELCLQIQSYAPSLLILVEQCEVQLFVIEQKLRGSTNTSQFLPLVADILDDQRMRMIFSRYRPQLIFHAAAHKHVPLMEHQPSEAFQNNAVGTMRLADLALEFDVEYMVQISTDKAINPTNVMGATKRLAELYLQALNNCDRTKTKFVAVRFGNVLGSSGSVIPTFKRQIAEGGPVTVTHPDVTRYFMTVQEAVGLVLQSATQGAGGEIFVLDMGSPIKITDLAKQLIELSGLEPEIDIEIKFTGLRPGEKLFEELNHSSEYVTPTTHPKIMRFTGVPLPYSEISTFLKELRIQSHRLEADELKLAFQKIIPEYKPYLATR